jgi:hypothetical protein
MLTRPDIFNPHRCAQFTDDMKEMFDGGAIHRGTFALTTEIEIVDHCQLGQPGERVVAVGLGNSTKLQLQFPPQRHNGGLKIFPIAFSAVACGVQGKGAPKVYQRLAEPIRQRVKDENDGVNIFKVESFQLYNSTKQQIRSNLQGFYAGRSILTGATCRMASQGSVKDRNRQAKMRQLVDDGEPFRQIIDGCHQAIQEGQIRTRIEPVVSICFTDIDDQPNPWEFVVQLVMHPLFEMVRDNVEEICYEMVDLYHPMVLPLLYIIDLSGLSQHLCLLE